MITQSELKSFLRYCPVTGNFFWIAKPNRNIVIGSKAGGLDKNGYVKIRLLDNQYYAHRLVFLYITGKFPSNLVDHIDGNRSNNIFSNLRLANYSENNQNARKSSTNTTGIKGISFCRQMQRFKGTINYNKRYYHVGYFLTLEEAKKEVERKRESLAKEFTNHGNN